MICLLLVVRFSLLCQCCLFLDSRTQSHSAWFSSRVNWKRLYHQTWLVSSSRLYFSILLLCFRRGWLLSCRKQACFGLLANKAMPYANRLISGSCCLEYCLSYLQSDSNGSLTCPNRSPESTWKDCHGSRKGRVFYSKLISKPFKRQVLFW